MARRQVAIELRLLGPDDVKLLDRVADEVFDNPVDTQLVREFLNDDRHHIVVAIDGGRVVGMATAVDYVHPDKAPQLFINEVSVAPTHRLRGVGRQLVRALLDRGASLGCTEAWLATEESNTAARRLYESVGGVAEPCVLYQFRWNQV